MVDLVIYLTIVIVMVVVILSAAQHQPKLQPLADKEPLLYSWEQQMGDEKMMQGVSHVLLATTGYTKDHVTSIIFVVAPQNHPKLQSIADEELLLYLGSSR